MKKDFSVAATQGGVPPQDWRRVHPLTPLLNSASLIFVILGIGFWNGISVVADMRLGDSFARADWGTVVAVISASLFGFVVLVALFSWVSWRVTAYAVTDRAVWFKRGIVFKTQSHARLEVVQAVDIVQPLLARIFGLGKLRVEVAGNKAATIEIAYLPLGTLREVSEQILAGVHAVTSEPADAAPISPAPISPAPISPAPINSGHPAIVQPRATEPNRPLFSVPLGRLVASQFWQFPSLFALLFIVVVCVAVVLSLTADPVAGVWGIFGLIPGIVVVGIATFAAAVKDYNFRATATERGIRIKRGLLETRSETIPPRRVHGVEIIQPFLWRPLGWYQVRILQAGQIAPDSKESGTAQFAKLLPVGTKEEALLALWLVFPDLGVEDPMELVQQSLEGRDSTEYFLSNPRRSWIFDPIVWRRRALALTKTCAVIRDGRIVRRASFLPYARVQSITFSAGPWQQHRDLATLTFNMVPGHVPTAMRHMSTDTAFDAYKVASAQANEHRQNESQQKWLQRVENRLQMNGSTQVNESIYAPY